MTVQQIYNETGGIDSDLPVLVDMVCQYVAAAYLIEDGRRGVVVALSAQYVTSHLRQSVVTHFLQHRGCVPVGISFSKSVLVSRKIYRPWLDRTSP